jgi:hypothetical protein
MNPNQNTKGQPASNIDDYLKSQGQGQTSRMDSQAQHSSAKATPNRQTRRSTQGKILHAIAKIFDIIKALITITIEVIKSFFYFIVFLFSKGMEIISHPALPAVLAICAVVAVGALAVVPQWTMTGILIAKQLRFNQAVAITVALMVGFGLNIYQLSSELWKVSQNIAQAMFDLKINPSENLPEETLSNRLKNWLSYDFAKSKSARNLSYMIEFGAVGLTLALTFASGVSPLLMAGSVVMAAASLFLPELVVKMAAGMTNSSRAVAKRMLENDRTKYERLDFD